MKSFVILQLHFDNYTKFMGDAILFTMYVALTALLMFHFSYLYF